MVQSQQTFFYLKEEILGNRSIIKFYKNVAVLTRKLNFKKRNGKYGFLGKFSCSKQIKNERFFNKNNIYRISTLGPSRSMHISNRFFRALRFCGKGLWKRPHKFHWKWSVDQLPIIAAGWKCALNVMVQVLKFDKCCFY